MNKTIAYSILLLTAVHSYGQEASPQPQMSKQDYLQKSKHQKTAAWIMLGAGTVTAIVGISIYSHDLNVAAENDPAMTFFTLGLNANPRGGYVFLAGTISGIASIPLFVSSSRNHKKALSLSLKNEKTSTIVHASLRNEGFPAVSLRLNL